MKIRAALLAAAALGAALAVGTGAADARTKRPRLAVAKDVTAQDPSVSGGAFIPIAETPPPAEGRWTLRPIADDYDRVDRYGFRLKLRGAGMKMRVPLSLH